MKKLFKDRNLYFLLKQPYPENLYLKKFPIWTNKRLLPEFEKPLEKTIRHLKKKRFHLHTGDGAKKTYPLFSFGQAEIHVCSPRTLFQKTSSFYKRLVEKKKYCILYGLSNQKKLCRDLSSMGMYGYILLEKKIDIVFFKTGIFQSLTEVQKEINHGRLRWNGEKILSFSIRGIPGDSFQINQSRVEMNEKKGQQFDKKISRRLFFQPFFLQLKKTMLTLKKIIFYLYLSCYRKKIST